MIKNSENNSTFHCKSMLLYWKSTQSLHCNDIKKLDRFKDDISVTNNMAETKKAVDKADEGNEETFITIFLASIYLRFFPAVFE